MTDQMTPLRTTPFKTSDQLAVEHPAVNREIAYTYTAIGFEALVCIFVANGLGRILIYRLQEHNVRLIATDLFFFICLGCLMVGSLIYQVTRLGYLYRRQIGRAHV